MAESFGERLRKVREEKGLSQVELAEKAGLGSQPSAVSHFELGRRSPSFDNLKRLADALSVTIDYLLGRQPQPTTAGPVADQLFRNFDAMSSEDQAALARFADALAKQNESRRSGDPKS
jgi:transcriptional regulator with XRE-family HTH domain